MNLKNKLESLMLGIILSVATSSCNSSDNSNEAEEKTPVKTEQKEKQEHLRDYYIHILDSVEKANDYDKLYDRNWDLRNDQQDSINKLDSIKYKYTLEGTMDNTLIKANSPVIIKAYNDIGYELSKYKIELPTIDDISESKDDEFSINQGLYYHLIANGWEFKHFCFNEEHTVNSFKTLIYRMIDESQYGEGQKNSMKNKVNEIMNETTKKLLTNKQKIENQYSDYYLITDKAKQHLGYSDLEGDIQCGYDMLQYENGKYLVTVRKIHIYDAKLSVDFFGDKDTDYKLVSAGNNKWQIVKTTKSGKISKTHVFTDNSTYDTYTYTRFVKPQRLYTLYFTPGKNMGVHIDVEETKVIKQRKKDWMVTIPKKEQEHINNLNKFIDKADLELQQKEDSITDIYNKASALADSAVFARFGQHAR